MTALEILSLLAILTVAIGWYLSYTAARLDRLHTRVEGTFAALDAQLIRRAEAVLELANTATLDPAASLFLAGAASDCLDQSVGSLEDALHAQGQREIVESELTEAMRLVLTEDTLEDVEADPGVGADCLVRLDAAHRRVQLARRFHNDAVTDVVRIRRKPLVQAFRLAGHADLPRTVDLDDDLLVLS